MLKKEDMIEIGRLTKVHGLKGELNFVFTNDVWDEVEADYLIVETDGLLVPFFLEEYRFKNDEEAFSRLYFDDAKYLVNKLGIPSSDYALLLDAVLQTK